MDEENIMLRVAYEMNAKHMTDAVLERDKDNPLAIVVLNQRRQINECNNKLSEVRQKVEYHKNLTEAAERRERDGAIERDRLKRRIAELESK